MLFVNPSRIRLPGWNHFLPIWVPTQVFVSFYFSFKKKGSEFWLGIHILFFSSFRSSRVPTRASFWIPDARVGTNCYVENSSSQTRFSLLSFILKNWVPTRVFIFLFWSSSSNSGFLLVPMFAFNCFIEVRVLKLGFSHLFFYFEKSGFWLGFSLLYIFLFPGVLSSDSDFLSDSTLVLEHRSFENSSFKNSIFSFLLFWKSGFRLGFFFCIFLFLKFRVPTRTSYRIQRSCWNSFLWKFEFQKLGFSHFIFYFENPSSDSGFPLLFFVWSFEFRLGLPIGFNARVGTDRSFENLSFQNSIFSFIFYFEKPGSDSGFPFYIYSFEVSSSDSDFLSDSTLVLEPIVPLKIRVFKLDFLFYLLFWKSGFRLGFSLLSFRLKFRVLTSDFLSDSTLVLEPIVPLKIRVLKLDFLFYLLFWKIGFRLGFSLFYIYILIFGVSSSDSDFLSDSTLVLEPIVPLKIWVFKNSIFSFIFILKDPGSDSGFPLFVYISYFSELRVPTRTSYRIQRSCWNQSFLWKFEFSKLDFLIHSFILKIRVSTRVFPFIFHFCDFEFRLGFLLLIQCSYWTKVFSYIPFQVKGQTWISPSG